LIANYQGQRAGLLTYLIEGIACEIVSLDSVIKRKGIASALIERIKSIAQESGCERVWLVTTNDNLSALRFYQKRDFIMDAFHAGAIQHSRKLKPSISLFGKDGISIRDEIELAYYLRKIK
jgi:ribosomal protein S18 acetylase RimI-like enzyme